MTGVDIHPTARIECDEFVAGPGTIIRANVAIYGRRVILGRECFLDEGSVIGGGSAGDGELVAGDWLHLGMYGQINTARTVQLGDEVGLGIGTRLFSHGSYCSEYDGFPVSFAPVTVGSRVWLPNALVLPGVNIGSDVVVAAGSVVTGDLPTGCLAGGTPARVLREGAYPKQLSIQQRFEILTRICAEAKVEPDLVLASRIRLGDTHFFVGRRAIVGPVTVETEQLRQQLRRHGIRFRYGPVDGEYRSWETP